MNDFKPYRCEQCVHGIYDPYDETFDCGAGCIEISECKTSFIEVNN